MPRKYIVTTLFFALLLSTAALVYADRVTVIQDGRNRNINGTILNITAEKLTIETGNNKDRQEIPANTIVSTLFEKEPSQLNSARSSASGSRMAEAIETLKKIDPKSLTRNEMKADYDYINASCLAKLAITGSGKPDEAVKVMGDFLKNHKSSYHYYEICELYGDLLVQMGKFSNAKKSYEELAKSPWPEYKLKANISLAMAEVTEKSFDKARKNFEKVAQDEDESDSSLRWKQLAKVGLAICDAEQGKAAQAIQTLTEIARESAGEDSLFQSTVYNALGAAYEKDGKTKEAVFAYMHTDILFAAARNEHIKALKELSKLWKKLNRNDRAEDIDKRLKSLYNL